MILSDMKRRYEKRGQPPEEWQRTVVDEREEGEGEGGREVLVCGVSGTHVAICILMDGRFCTLFSYSP
jgi:hypothetical protein